MGGSAGPGNHTAAAEFNAFADPEAAQAVLDFGLPLAMVGLDACRQLRVRKTDAERLRSAGSAPGRVLGDLLEAYVRIADPQGAKPMAFYDPTAAVALVEPGAVDFRRGRLDIELEGRHTRGMTVIEWRVPRRAEANAEVATTVDEDRARAIVLAALGDAARGH
jgi:purine nucleosidase